jgi:hypothetical protein
MHCAPVKSKPSSEAEKEEEWVKRVKHFLMEASEAGETQKKSFIRLPSLLVHGSLAKFSI